jgi:hypothetical protein
MKNNISAIHPGYDGIVQPKSFHTRNYKEGPWMKTGEGIGILELSNTSITRNFINILSFQYRAQR